MNLNDFDWFDFEKSIWREKKESQGELQGREEGGEDGGGDVKNSLFSDSTGNRVRISVYTLSFLPFYPPYTGQRFEVNPTFSIITQT